MRTLVTASVLVSLLTHVASQCTPASFPIIFGVGLNGITTVQSIDYDSSSADEYLVAAGYSNEFVASEPGS